MENHTVLCTAQFEQEKVEFVFVVEADSKEEAESKAMDMLFSYDVSVDGETVEELVDDEGNDEIEVEIIASFSTGDKLTVDSSYFEKSEGDAEYNAKQDFMNGISFNVKCI